MIFKTIKVVDFLFFLSLTHRFRVCCITQNQGRHGPLRDGKNCSLNRVVQSRYGPRLPCSNLGGRILNRGLKRINIYLRTVLTVFLNLLISHSTDFIRVKKSRELDKQPEAVN